MYPDCLTNNIIISFDFIPTSDSTDSFYALFNAIRYLFTLDLGFFFFCSRFNIC